MNLLTAIGRIGKDAELKYTAKGDAICNFSLVVNSGFGDKQIGTWWRCAIFGKRAETLAPMLLKGLQVGVSGEPTNTPYTAKDGAEKYSLDLRVNDVTLLGNKGDASARPAQTSQPQAQDAEFDDQIPF